jgi:hypothetical protein
LGVSRSIRSSGGGGRAVTTLASHAWQVAAMHSGPINTGHDGQSRISHPAGGPPRTKSRQLPWRVGIGIWELLMVEARKTTKLSFILEEGSQVGFIAD